MSRFFYDTSTCYIQNTSNLGSIVFECLKSDGTSVQVASFSTSGISLNFSDQTQTTAYTPTGSILPFTGIELPSGYLWCNGSSYNKASHSDLFQVIQNIYGGVDPNFNVPNLNEKFPLGAETNTSMNVNTTLNGNSRTDITGGNITMTTNQMISHSHKITFNTNQYIESVVRATNTLGGGNGMRLISSNGNDNFPIETNSVGNNDSQRPPWVAVQYIIKF
jgi:microcystin-dependent protein